jgi:hypothetical protein
MFPFLRTIGFQCLDRRKASIEDRKTVSLWTDRAQLKQYWKSWVPALDLNFPQNSRSTLICLSRDEAGYMFRLSPLIVSV